MPEIESSFKRLLGCALTVVLFIYIFVYLFLESGLPAKWDSQRCRHGDYDPLGPVALLRQPFPAPLANLRMHFLNAAAAAAVAIHDVNDQVTLTVV